MKEQERWTWGAWLVALFLMLLGALTVHDAMGQRLDARIEGGLDLWAQSDRCYQHTWQTEVEAEMNWGRLNVTGHVTRRIWGACDAKIPSSPINAEADKVNEMIHGAYGTLRLVDGLRAGVQVHRRKAHHIWRNKRSKENRHNHFPGSWQIGRETANGGSAPNWPEGGPQRPSIGYWDAFGPRLAYRADAGHLAVTYLPFRWKSLTLPYSEWLLRGEYRPNEDWMIRVEANRDVLERIHGRLRVERRVIRSLWMGVEVAKRNSPDWAEPLRYVSATVVFRPSSLSYDVDDF